MADSSGTRPLGTSPQGCSTTFLLYGFGVGSAVLEPEHRRFLRETVADILEAPRNQVALIGRASRSGPERQNLRLSRRRAEAAARCLRAELVARNLASQGAQGERVQVEYMGESSPFSTDRESPDDRSVEVRLRVPQDFVLVLQDVGLVRQSRVLVKTIRDAVEPLVRAAGRQLTIERVGGWAESDLIVTFEPGGHESRPCGPLFFGEGGGGQVSVGAHRDLRVCGNPRRGSLDPTRLDYAPTIERVFDEDSDDFARAVANTAIHELGHMISDLKHSADPQDFMITGDLPLARRSREAYREFFAGKKHFSDADRKRLICAIQSGHYAGGMRVHGSSK